MYRLTSTDRGATGVLLETGASLVLIGSAPNARVRLNSPGIAARHALIERRGAAYYLCDLGSEAGVSVNGHPVKDQHLVSGDEIEIGPVRLQFEVLRTPEPLRHRFDGLQLIASLAVAVVIVGEVVAVTWMVAQPRSRNMRKETRRAVKATVGTSNSLPFATAGTNAPVTPAPATNEVAAHPAVLNRMLRIVRVERTNAADHVALRINVRAQVGERQLDPAAVAVQVEWHGPATPPAVVTLPVPSGWENFSSKTLAARWEGVPAQLRGVTVRTFYRDKLQDVVALAATP